MYKALVGKISDVDNATIDMIGGNVKASYLSPSNMATKPSKDSLVWFDNNSRVALGLQDPKKNPIELGEDDVVIFAKGNYIHIRTNGDIEIKATNLTIDANVTINGSLINNGVNVGSTHKHGGVTSGGAVTGIPS